MPFVNAELYVQVSVRQLNRYTSRPSYTPCDIYHSILTHPQVLKGVFTY